MLFIWEICLVCEEELKPGTDSENRERAVGQSDQPQQDVEEAEKVKRTLPMPYIIESLKEQVGKERPAESVYLSS